MIRTLPVVMASGIFMSAAYAPAERPQIVYTPPAPKMPCDWQYESPWAHSTISLPVVQEDDATHYRGFVGRWVEVCATVYTPTNKIDEDYYASKGKYRWKTADGRTDVRRVPYGIAVPLQRRSDKKIPVLSFGTKVIIPTGYGYLDRSRPEDRVFQVDDTSESQEYFYSKDGKLHIDVRFVDLSDAIRWAGPKGYRFIKIFVIED